MHNFFDILNSLSNFAAAVILFVWCIAPSIRRKRIDRSGD